MKLTRRLLAAAAAEGCGIGSAFDTLGLHPAATRHDVKERFHQLARIYHPDVGGSQSQFRDIHTAYLEVMRGLGEGRANPTTSSTAAPHPHRSGEASPSSAQGHSGSPCSEGSPGGRASGTLRGVAGSLVFSSGCPLSSTRQPHIKHPECLAGLGKGSALLGTRMGFAGLVVYIISCSRRGASGVVINQPWELSGPFSEGTWTGCGGSVECDTAVTVVKDSGHLCLDPAPSDLAAPDVARVYAGYVTWGPSQLEREVLLQDWGVLQPGRDVEALLCAPPLEVEGRARAAARMVPPGVSDLDEIWG